jgi:hypothetical protein
MNSRTGGFGGLLERLDRWNERSHWMPDAAEWFPRKVFVGFLIWNFPILAITVAIVFAMMHSANPVPNNEGILTPLNWIVELIIGAVILAAIADITGCLYIRALWNRRARKLRKEEDYGTQ